MRSNGLANNELHDTHSIEDNREREAQAATAATLKIAWYDSLHGQIVMSVLLGQIRSLS